MGLKKTFDHYVTALPSVLQPEDHYYVKSSSDTFAKHYIASKTGAPIIVGNNNYPPNLESIIISATAGENISGGKAVVIDDDGKAYAFNILNEEHSLKTFGIAKQAGVTGNSMEIYVGGKAYEAGSGWQAGKAYYVSSSGILTTAIPDAGIIKQAGVGLSSDTILIYNVLPIIKL